MHRRHIELLKEADIYHDPQETNLALAGSGAVVVHMPEQPAQPQPLDDETRVINIAGYVNEVPKGPDREAILARARSREVIVDKAATAEHVINPPKLTKFVVVPKTRSRTDCQPSSRPVDAHQSGEETPDEHPTQAIPPDQRPKFENQRLFENQGRRYMVTPLDEHLQPQPQSLTIPTPRNTVSVTPAVAQISVEAANTPPPKPVNWDSPRLLREIDQTAIERLQEEVRRRIAGAIQPQERETVWAIEPVRDTETAQVARPVNVPEPVLDVPDFLRQPVLAPRRRQIPGVEFKFKPDERALHAKANDPPPELIDAIGGPYPKREKPGIDHGPTAEVATPIPETEGRKYRVRFITYAEIIAKYGQIVIKANQQPNGTIISWPKSPDVIREMLGDSISVQTLSQDPLFMEVLKSFEIKTTRFLEALQDRQADPLYPAQILDSPTRAAILQQHPNLRLEEVRHG